tara:strand:+ start:63534 stop:64553 length:1020 start_codon:yes stop_codon:yes gene_type:complete
VKEGLSNRLSRYINEVYTEFVLGEPWQMAASLPLYLQAGYSYQCARLDGQICLLMLAQEVEQEDSATRLKKHIGVVAKQFKGPVIYVVQETTSYNRKRLIGQRIAFAVPGKQLYLPFLGTDLRENFGRSDTLKDKASKLGAVAQQIVLLKLYDRWDTQQAALAIAERLAVSKMTVSRAYGELVAVGLARLEVVGRIKRLLFTAEHRELWQLAQPFLTSPIKKRVWIDEHDYQQHAAQLRQLAGESALAELGLLMMPKNKTVVVSFRDWGRLKKLMAIHEQVRRNDQGVAVELWKYDPAVLSARGTVDGLSLYLSLAVETDDRVVIAREELLSDVWNRDL